MINASICAVLVMMLTAGFANAVLGPSGTPALNYRTPLTPGRSVHGVVTNIDTVNNVIQVEDSNGIIQAIVVDGQTQIQRNGEPVRLNSLSIADSVTVSK
jgi:hypothetical protein